MLPLNGCRRVHVENTCSPHRLRGWSLSLVVMMHVISIFCIFPACVCILRPEPLCLMSAQN